ncbi:uncharacterized protein LOC142328675 isoform X2 [Lycorma delicatula]|uniref:uncharacterized protein LOC142328675 isoform X2 n=1 Tax=Lycorma delicatula TaxID=130591 RepID=UPI003F51237B
MNRDADETKGRDRERDSSRDSKDSGREVRCGCQYFQSDSLLPDRQCLVGTKPVSRPSSRQSHHEVGGTRMTMGDHEYEPITPMATTQQPNQTPPPVVEVTDSEVQQKPKKARSTRIQYIDNDPNIMFIPLHGSSDEDQENDEKHYLRIPTDEDIIIPQDVDADADQEDNQDDQEDRDIEEDLSAQEIQNRMEERFFAPTPTTTESRTDCEINTSQIDSSGLEDLPLKRDARKAADMSSKGFQQRIRSQAGRLRTKIRNISKPKINLPDKSKFHLPERPKFNLPERPKFKMPERPKINLPERPKFNLPDRPKFNMPQRPKISMPNFQLGKTRTSSLRRPLRDRNQFSSSQSTVGSKKNIFESLNFRTYPRFFNKKKRLAEQNAKLKGKRALTPPPRMETDSIPSSPGSRKGPFGQKWTQRFKDIKFADDENRSNQSEKQSASLKAMSSFEDDEPVEDDSAAFRDPDFRTATSLDETKKKIKARSSNSLIDSDKEQRSSGSSSDRHRAGVLEEIDSDEFFLREKGLSREDVDLSRFLSNEIRDAFRSPKNALASIDRDLYNDEDDEEICEVNSRTQKMISHPTNDKAFEQKQQHTNERESEIEMEHQEPIKPSRSRSLRSKRSSQSKTSIDIKDENTNFNTYPPTRPSRSRKQSMQSSLADKQSIGTADIKDLELELKEGYDEDEVCLDIRVPSVTSLDEADAGKLISGRESMNEIWPQETQPPLPPKRRKSTKDLTHDNDSIINEICPEDKWVDEVNIQAMVPGEVTALHMEPIFATVTPLRQHDYDTPPVAPIRKARSRGTSLADEDRTSRGAESLVSESQSYPVEDMPVEEMKQETKEDNFGYAIVEKSEHKTVEKPERHKRNGNNKPPRPPPPSRRKRATTQMLNLKNQGINFFFTYPRRAMKSLHKPPPVRPNRNYSTIGPFQTLPSRPPRRTKVFREPVYADGDNIPFMDESEKETLDSSTPKVEQTEEIIPKDEPTVKDDETEEAKETTRELLIGSNDETKDLQSGDVIEKMKARPLPAPPRPARKSKGDIQLHSDVNKLELTDDKENNEMEEVIVTERIDIQITPPKEIKTTPEIKTMTTIITEEKKETDIIPTKSSPEIKQESEKKEGPLAALKEMISQKKKEFFEPKKETTIKTETVVTKVESKVDEGSLVKIIPLKGTNDETEIKVEESNVSTQTDPLPEGYIVEEVQQTEEPSLLRSKTPEHILSKLPSITELKTESTGSSAPAQLQQSPVVQEVHTIIEKKVVVMPDPDTEVSFLKAQKLQVSELDVDKLNVSELQAKKISVSDIDGVAMQVSELSSKSGNLVLNGVELPPDFLRNLASSISSSSSSQPQPPPLQQQIQASTQTNPQPQEVSEKASIVTTSESTQQSTQPPPVVVYPSQTPIVVYPPQTNASGQPNVAVHPAIIPQIFSPDYALPLHTIPRTRSPPRNLPEEIPSHPGDSEEDNGSLMPVPKRPHRHHHHHHHHSQKYSQQSTDEEDEKSSIYNRQQQLQQQTSAQLIRQLLQIWQNSLSNGVIQVIESINRVFPEGEKRKDAQTAACIILVLIAGLVIVGFGSSDKTVHHHHWDFQFPPPH